MKRKITKKQEEAQRRAVDNMNMMGKQIVDEFFEYLDKIINEKK